MIFGFTVLSLVLFAGGLVFAYLLVKSQFTTAIKSRDRRLARDMKTMRDRFASMQLDLDRTNQNLAEVAKLAATSKTVPSVGMVTPFERMQNRVEQTMPNVVVNETPVTARNK